MEPTLPPNNPVVAPAAPTPTPAVSNSEPPKSKNLLLVVLLVLLVVFLAAGSYYVYLNKVKKNPVAAHNTTTIATVTVPKDAIVTAECVANRGKQYILTKDIPDGPIYDVVAGKVVAIEYLIGLKELVATPDNFKDLMLEKGQYDHLALVPTDPHAGMTEQHFHAIAYLISVNEAKAITCSGGAASSSTNMPQMH